MTSKIRILVADDDEIVKIIWQQFSNPLYQITFVTDGQQIVDLDLRHIDIILTDINMPKLSGIKATKTIRKAEQNCKNKIPIIGITSHSGDDIMKKCLEAGMNEVLTKPVFPNDIDAVITRWNKAICAKRKQTPKLIAYG